ncbi:hypothetical protein FOZ63_028167 [Perkinsus olseni]|uniref:Uncharacterized protein n=1 Tax=Perkinsus olseni TaxID=32597 RepID=A0A7J6SNK5_PEROL|nr:hypothetical protein FOZ63_028167 [Perkinsus olseni]
MGVAVGHLNVVVRTGKTMEILFKDYKTKLRGELRGPTEIIEEAFSGVNPFPNLFSKIRPKLDSKMTNEVCWELTSMDQNSLRGGPAERGWIKEFLDDKMDEAFVLIQRHGGTVENF